MSFSPFQLLAPEQRTSCAVFNSPHSGSHYPQELMNVSALGPHEIRRSEDAFVDELFADAIDFGAPMLSANYPRAFVDLNRSREEMDPAVVYGVPRRGTNPRIAAGLGVIPRVVAEGRPILRGKLSPLEAEDRLVAAYDPYHRALVRLIGAQIARFGIAVLFDCHSMPHEALTAAPTIGSRRPEVILGDRFGAACDAEVIELTHAAFVDQGFVVARNAPFAGGYITQHYGRPGRNVHAVQIEIDRSLYMDEKRIERLDSFDEVRQRLRSVIGQLCQIGQSRFSVAAE